MNLGLTKSFQLWFTAVLILLCAPAYADFNQSSRGFEESGQFAQAAALLQKSIADTNTTPAERRILEFELDRLDRIRLDYPFTRPELLKKLKAAVRDISADEFEKWIAEKRFDTRVIDGEEKFMGSSVANLFFRYPELNPRRIQPKDESFQKALWENCVAIRQAAARENSPYVLPKMFDVMMTITLDADAVAAGKTVNAWLPVPRSYPYQDGFELVSSSSPVKHLAPEASAIRSLYLEQPAVSNAPTVFKIHYHYRTQGVRFEVEPEKVRPFDGKDSAVGKFTREAPQVVFSTAMKTLSEKILAGEKNPARQAKLLYEWIGTHIQYSFATEYSTVPNLSEYCRSHGYGDCGQEALLFITLCRLNGIPARWQSGWDTFPGAQDIHDWTEIHLAPYGWMPVDPYMSIFATQYATQLTSDQRREVRDFYFGGRGQWRMAANADHEQLLVPAKKSFRSDDVDFQRGELECEGKNIYFNRYHYNFVVKELPASAKQLMN
ncbi:MAG TPA: transglutaminase-like domain-containing protein [Verrucomicrobiae bacterium]|nr:transglutaminase-like domain-containing protein [Verrucomicrobiae bacterium]